jgi:glutamine cyclotransferase
MASRTTYPFETAKPETVLLTAKLTGGGAATSLVNDESSRPGAGEIVSATYTSTGKYSVAFRHKYPTIAAYPTFAFVGTTDGLTGQCSAINVVAGTASIEFFVGTVPTDLATTDKVSVTWAVRNLPESV